MSNNSYRNTSLNSDTPTLTNVSKHSPTTDYVLHGTVESVYELLKSGLQHHRVGAEPIRIYYKLDDSSEQISKAEAAIVQNLVDVWNSFTAVVSDVHITATQLRSNREITRVESDAITIPRGLSTLSGIVYIDATYVLPDDGWGTPSHFELYRGILTAIAAASEGLVYGKSLAICPPDSELSVNEVYTLNTLGKLLLSRAVIVEKSPISTENPFEYMLTDYANLAGIEEFTKAVTEFPRRILAVRNGLLLAEDYPELKAKAFLEPKVKAKRK